MDLILTWNYIQLCCDKSKTVTRTTERRQPSFRLKVMEIGTCRPLQVNCRMQNAYGGERRDGVTTCCRSHQICKRTQLGHHDASLHSVPYHSAALHTLTLISGLCCSRCQTAALQPHPPERNAFRT